MDIGVSVSIGFFVCEFILLRILQRFGNQQC